MPSSDAPIPGFNRVFVEIAGIATPRRALKGATLYATLDPSPDFFLVVEGRLRIERLTAQGLQSLGRAGPGDFAGAAEALLAISRLGHAVAEEDTRLLAVPAAEVFGGAPSPELGDYILRRLAGYLRSLNDEFGKFFGSELPRAPIEEPS